MTLLDRIILLVTGLVALYLVLRLGRKEEKPAGSGRQRIYYAAAFAVLLVAGLLLIALGYGILANPLVVIVAALIPACLSLGLVADLGPRWEVAYGVFALLGLGAIAVTRFVGAPVLGTIVLALVHSVAGLLIFILPLVAAAKKVRPWSFAWVTVGGTLIGIGGIALAMLKTGHPILSAGLIQTILAPLLLLMTVAFALGFVRGRQGPGVAPKGASHPG